MGINFEDEFLGDPSLLDEISDDVTNGAWGWPWNPFTKKGSGYVCTLTAECQRWCRSPFR